MPFGASERSGDSSADAGMIFSQYMRAGRTPSGSAVMMRTVVSSTFSAPVSEPKKPSLSVLASATSLTMRFTVATTESALNGVPSWNVTPSRSLNSQVVSSTCVGSSVARPGCSVPSASLVSRVS